LIDEYRHTLIAVADDCPVVPKKSGTIAAIQYELIVSGEHTQSDVLFSSWLLRQPKKKRTKSELTILREKFFSKPQACLRASPLPKKYGWGLLFDRDGRVSLCAMESAKYKQIVSEKRLVILKALRSSRS